MSGKQPVAVANISYHLKCGDKNCDWVFAGALVFKSGLKTSQKVLIYFAIFRFAQLRITDLLVVFNIRVVNIVYGKSAI